ncbi:LacI family DNA-binding transcriptional regulator [Humitalea sp. 24SJ18S-53]|uniref:LacI family DNA-binding transcriptional regulator n=1 Tax=Humitalea sp. 24SJ18S-53 TaxID=3422307 RepID=UPI003D671E20
MSQSAVSRTFTPGASVAPAMREKVLEAARVLGYRPNLIARSLITRRSRIVGVAVGYLRNQFYSEVLEVLSERLQARGYHLLLFIAPQRGDADPQLEEVLHYQVDALVLLSATLSSRLAAECCANGVPVVLFNRTTRGAGIESVTGDNLAGGRRVAEFLVAGGHEHFAFVAGLADSSTGRDRERGFREGLAAHGVTRIERVEGDYDFEQAGRAADALFARPQRPDAVFCANDHMAFAVMDAARRRHGLRVPEDVSIIGFDDVGPAHWAGYDLTTYSQPVGPMVEAAVALLEARLADSAAPAQHVVVPGELVVRGSARVPRDIVACEGRRVWRGDAAPAGSPSGRNAAQSDLEAFSPENGGR